MNNIVVVCLLLLVTACTTTSNRNLYDYDGTIAPKEDINSIIPVAFHINNWDVRFIKVYCNGSSSPQKILRGFVFNTIDSKNLKLRGCREIQFNINDQWYSEIRMVTGGTIHVVAFPNLNSSYTYIR